MKELLSGIVVFLGSTIVFTLMIIIGMLFNLVYPFYMAYKAKDWKLFFKIWWRLIDGTLAVFGKILYTIGVQWDIMGNVWGEWIEDGVAQQEKTKFGEKNITVSAAFGYIEHEKIFMYKRGHFISKVLNAVFMEKQHALGSWLKHLAYKKIEEKDLKGKK